MCRCAPWPVAGPWLTAACGAASAARGPPETPGRQAGTQADWLAAWPDVYRLLTHLHPSHFSHLAFRLLLCCLILPVLSRCCGFSIPLLATPPKVHFKGSSEGSFSVIKDALHCPMETHVYQYIFLFFCSIWFVCVEYSTVMCRDLNIHRATLIRGLFHLFTNWFHSHCWAKVASIVQFE